MDDDIEREKAVAVRLIEKATNSTKPEVDPRLLKSIKSVVRQSDSELRLAAQTLMTLLKRDHSQVRYLSLLIIDEIFMRSKLFRALLVENLEQLLTLSVGFRRNLPLPAPASVASVLRAKAIEFLEKWNASFGIHYRQLRLGYEYLKNTLRFQFPNVQANALRVQQERREREARTREILLKKFDSFKDKVSSIKDEIHSTIDEINVCLEILNAKGDEEDMQSVPLDGEEEVEEFRNSELQRLRHDCLAEGEKVRETTNNTVVFDALRELYKVLMTKHMVVVQEWISVLIRVETEDTKFRDNALKDFIDIRNNLKSVEAKCESSGCTLSKTTHVDDDVIWEDGDVSSFGTRKPVVTDLRCEASEKGNGHQEGIVKKDTSESNPLHRELLAEAPVMKWGPVMDNWGSKRIFLANQRGLDLDSHWGRVDHDAVIPTERIAELNVHATVYREDPVEIQPCRAPLSRKGGLCQRRDLRACPFHGVIVPRDDDGNPIMIHQGSIAEGKGKDEYDGKPIMIHQGSIAEGKGNDIDEFPPTVDMTQLARQAVKNVRERDTSETKQILKRAKRAKVREHNESVLRDAAIASSSTSYFAGEDQHAANGTAYHARNKEETLASMLKKKKETSKDRLGQKLLNARARDATQRQLTAAEDANYREAFPNQW
ncbi:unnamed protein product [Cuscuta campestris]|uniref:UV-stimulated scaffold protein A C-terminal domain-containing protein n=1 Tax=Cuscuta campestris TaxID=132261 RepID=A0A484LHK8_9ASTE|nr:unnamed protein product [Cuscuta campestris]